MPVSVRRDCTLQVVTVPTPLYYLYLRVDGFSVSFSLHLSIFLRYHTARAEYIHAPIDQTRPSDVVVVPQYLAVNSRSNATEAASQ